MRELYHRRYLIIVVVFLFSFGRCSMIDNGLRFERHPEGVDYDESYRIKVTRGQKVISSTLTQGGHYRTITVTVSAFDAVFVLDLHLNTYLFAVGYVERSFSKEGVVYHDVNHTEGHCYYLGNVRDQPQSSAAVSTCKGIVGYFTVGNVSYHIDPASNELHGPHRVYRSRSDAKTVYRCGHESVSLNLLLNPEKHRRRLKRFAWPQDFDKKNKVVELYVTNDYSQYLAKGSDMTAVIQRAKNIVNIASAGYQPLGIYIVLVGVEVWNMGNNITVNTSDADSTLDEWANYRMTYVNPYHYNDNGVLITNNTFGSIIGLAYLGGMSKNRVSAAFVGDVHLPSVAGSIMDHEMGHNFGLIHDTETGAPCPCPDPNSKCIMYPETNSATPSFTWSQCSLDQFAYSFQHGLDICLYNVPQTVEPNNVCGNGIVDNGEQCDCGNSTTQECNKACCDHTTCQLVSPATCAYGRCCNISTCQRLPCGNLCRAKADLNCDLNEFCDGLNHLCPTDTRLPDGANCTVNGVAAYCYNGLCRSHQSQCELLWGPGTLVSVDLCYNQNVNGDLYGNCGINWLPNVTYVRCSASDVNCGILQCKDLNRNVSYYEKPYQVGESWFSNNETCHVVIFDFGLGTQDPGYVPSGAECGNGKMCVNQQCRDVSSLNTIPCSSSCQTNEVCNNLGQCQSNYGSCQQSTTATTLTTRQTSATTSPVPTTTTLTLTTSTLTTTKTTPNPTTTTPTTTETTPTPTTSTTTPTTSTPTVTKTTPTPTTSTPPPTTTTPTTTKTTPPPTTSTPTPTTSTPTTTKTTSSPTTSTPTPITNTPTTTETTPTPTTSTPTPTTTAPTTTKTTPTPTTSTTSPIKSTPTTTKTTPTPTTSTPTATTSTPTATTSTPTTTKITPTQTTSTPTLTTSTPTTTKTTPTPTTSTPTQIKSTPTTTKTTPTPTTSTPIPTTSTPTTTKTTPTPTTGTPTQRTRTPTTTKTTPTPTTSTPTPTTSTAITTKTTPTPTTGIPTQIKSTPTTTKTTPTPTTSTPILTTSTPNTTKTTPTPTTSTPTPTTSTAITTKTTPTPTTSTPTPTTGTPTTTKTTSTPTRGTPTSTTGTPTTTKTATTPTTSTSNPTTNTPTMTKTTPTARTRTPTTNAPQPATSASTPTTGSPTLTSSTPIVNGNSPTSGASEPKPTTTTPFLTTRTQKSVQSTPIGTTNAANSSTTALFPTVPNSTTSTPKSSISTKTPITTTRTPSASTLTPTTSTLIPITSTLTPRTSTPEVTTTETPTTTLVLGLVLGVLALITAAVVPLACSYMFCPGAFNSCFQLICGAGPTTARLPLGSFTTHIFTGGALPPVQRRWIPAERFYLPQRNIYTPVRPQNETVQPDWRLLRRPRQPFGRGYQYPNAFYPDLQPYSSTDNMVPDWRLLRRPRQPFGRGYQYPNAFYPNVQPYSSTDNMKTLQIVIR